ncbi:MAG TPA: hypothetical protein VMH26_09670 [Burkholderiales bacterium]|nr:hypothetical protein [Burkholderiales bacterium]
MNSVIIRAGILALALLSSPALGQSWHAVFGAEQGTRMDFFDNTRSFVPRKDASEAHRFEFTVPAEGNVATIRVLPVGTNTDPPADYDALVIVRGPDMVVLVMLHEGMRRGDTFESYTLYPKLGIGFITTTSSFLGNPLMKERAAVKPDIPSGSAVVFPLRRMDH